MRRVLVVLLVFFAATGAFAVDYTTFQSNFNTFVQDLSNGAAFNASNGLTWSDATGNFPHFGIGLTVGATTIPVGTVSAMATALGITLPSELGYLGQIGLPVPAYTVEARLGGFVLPFDIGLKGGYIPASLCQSMGSPITADFLLIGADVRYQILKDEGFIPGLSLGLGYSYMRENISVSGLTSGITIASISDGSQTHDLTMSDPTIEFGAQTNVLEAKLQLSKKLLFLTPYVGGVAAFSFGSSGTGSVQSQLLWGGSPITQQQADAITQYYKSNGQTPPDFSTTGFSATATTAAGWDFRAYGGLSVNIFFFALDLNASYDITNNAFGAGLNTRIAL
ncbi:MAG TPA: hypothetical protein VHE79_12230 [Spirochaetia bacterium]